MYSLIRKLVDKTIEEISITPWYKFGKIYYLREQLEYLSKVLNKIKENNL